MVRIRLTLEDDDGHEINGDTARVYTVPGGTARLVDMDTALEGLTQQAVPALAAEFLLLALHQCVTEVTKGAGTRRITRKTLHAAGPAPTLVDSSALPAA